MTSKHGSCLCGSIRWRYDGDFQHLTHCHCGMCRKAHGTGFATYAVGPREGFTWENGEALRVSRESSPGFIRSFCPRCGSVVPNTLLKDIVAAPAGGFSDDLGLSPTAHIFVKSKAAWTTLTDGLPQHDYYPGQTVPPVDRVSPTPSADGLLRGSCLCGAVAYEFEGAFSVVHNCHCSRCQRGRAAAHATNGLAPLGAVRITRGAESLVTFRPADARFFAQVFCGTCGGKMPRECPERKITIVPLGSLDDDTRQGPDDHIFVGSKASWFEITDALPRFPEAVTSPPPGT